jgi:hypothetical protein
MPSNASRGGFTPGTTSLRYAGTNCQMMALLEPGSGSPVTALVASFPVVIAFSIASRRPGSLARSSPTMPTPTTGGSTTAATKYSGRAPAVTNSPSGLRSRMRNPGSNSVRPSASKPARREDAMRAM